MAKKKRRLSAKARAAALRNLAKARRARGGVKRRRTRRVRTSTPRRTRRRMAKKRRSGRRKALKITPTFIAKAAVGLAGLKMMADAGAVGAAKYIIANPGRLADPKYYVEVTKQLGPGAAVALVGPKVAGKVITLATKAVPGSSRLTNATIVRV